MALLLLVGLTSGLAGCGLLDVSDPTTIEDGDLNDAASAEFLRGAALKRLSQAMTSGTYHSGLLADEFFADPFDPGTSEDELLDLRESVRFEALSSHLAYDRWQTLQQAASVAMPKLRAYAPVPAHLGEMFALRGFATLRLAEDFCPGFPLHEMVDYQLVYGPPLSTEAALERALADFDSAAVFAADSARVLQFVQVGRARTLLGLGRFEEAGSGVAGVPTAYVANAEYLTSLFDVSNDGLAFGLDLSRSVADQEGSSGLAFVTTADPRVVTEPLGTALDGVTPLFGLATYSVAEFPGGLEVPIVVASGIEARLIEAEAALRASNPNWLTILNDLRAAQVSPPLDPLADPGTPEAQVDLLFRERAFWLFATGHRLGDLRRLVRLYGRTAESVFPGGPYRLGGSYGTATSIPFPASKETPFNPAVTGCTSR